MALKSNLLLDAIGAPNLGIEVPFSFNCHDGLKKHFSAYLDFAWAGWHTRNNLYSLQTAQGSIGAKYWFNPGHGALTGWNAGIYGIYGSRYDIRWKDGWQGDGFWSVGISGGYAIPIAKRLNLEFSLAAGYFHTPEARHYHRPENGHLLWQQTRYNVGRFSLTKIQVNFIWLIGKK